MVCKSSYKFEILVLMLWYIRSFIHPSSDIIYKYRLDTSECRLTHDTPMSNYILPGFYKSGLISMMYNKYDKSFVEIIPLPASYGIATP